MLGGAALDAARKAQRGHSGGIVRLLLSAASRAADPLPGVQVARLIERDDEAREVGRLLVAMEAQVGDVLAAILADQPFRRTVQPVLLRGGGGLGPPFGRGRQQDLDGQDRVRAAALLAVLVHGVRSRDEGGGIGGGIGRADQDAVERRPLRVGVRRVRRSRHVVGGSGQGLRRLDLLVAVDGEGHGHFLSGETGVWGFPHPARTASGSLRQDRGTNGNGRGAPFEVCVVVYKFLILGIRPPYSDRTSPVSGSNVSPSGSSGSPIRSFIITCMRRLIWSGWTDFRTIVRVVNTARSFALSHDFQTSVGSEHRR